MRRYAPDTDRGHFKDALTHIYWGFRGVLSSFTYTIKWSTKIFLLSFQKPKFRLGELVPYHESNYRVVRIRVNYGYNPGFYYRLEKCPGIEFSEGVLTFYKGREGAHVKSQTQKV